MNFNDEIYNIIGLILVILQYFLIFFKMNNPYSKRYIHFSYLYVLFLIVLYCVLLEQYLLGAFIYICLLFSASSTLRKIPLFID